MRNVNWICAIHHASNSSSLLRRSRKGLCELSLRSATSQSSPHTDQSFFFFSRTIGLGGGRWAAHFNARRPAHMSLGYPALRTRAQQSSPLWPDSACAMEINPARSAGGEADEDRGGLGRLRVEMCLAAIADPLVGGRGAESGVCSSCVRAAERQLRHDGRIFGRPR